MTTQVSSNSGCGQRGSVRRGRRRRRSVDRSVDRNVGAGQGAGSWRLVEVRDVDVVEGGSSQHSLFLKRNVLVVRLGTPGLGQPFLLLAASAAPVQEPHERVVFNLFTLGLPLRLNVSVLPPLKAHVGRYDEL